MPLGSAQVQLPLSASGQIQDMDPANALQIAIKNNVGVYYFQTLIPLHAVLEESKGPDVTSLAFEDVWSSATGITFETPIKTDDFIQRLGRNGVHFIEQVSSMVIL